LKWDRAVLQNAFHPSAILETQRRMLVQARLASTARRRWTDDNSIADSEINDSFPDLFDNPRCFMPSDQGQRREPSAHVEIGMTDATEFYPYPHLSRSSRSDGHIIDDFERLSVFLQQSGVHDNSIL
jgi:hypothetical protein